MNRRKARMPLLLACLLFGCAGCASYPLLSGGEGDAAGLASAESAARPDGNRRASTHMGATRPTLPRAGSSVTQTAAQVEPSELPSPDPVEKDPETPLDRPRPADEPELLPPPSRPPPDPVPGTVDVEGAGRAVTLEEVVASVELHFPLLLAALEEQEITTGQLVAAQGAFDVNLRAREFWQTGTYESNRVGVGVDQNLAWNGISIFGGYRQAVGDFPIYYGDRKTGDGGEFRAGVLIPLLAGRAIDRRRATLAQAAIGRDLADPTIAAQRIDFIRAGSRAYWSWFATGRRYQVARAVLKIAEDRDKQLAELVRAGALGEIERVDNQRVIVERQARLIAAERAWQQASIALSLYLRDSAGNPRVPGAAGLPPNVPEPRPFDRARLEADIALAFEQRPELARLRLAQERAAVELDLAENLLLPGVGLGLEGYQDVGPGTAFSKSPLVKGTELDRSTFVASLQFDMPVQRREARGRARTAQSTIAQLGFHRQFQVDRIVAEIRDAASALERFHELLEKARENVEVARRVENGERERFMKGQGSIVILNLRELVTAEASFAEVDALAEYYRSLADYRAALGLDANLNLPEAPR